MLILEMAAFVKMTEGLSTYKKVLYVLNRRSNDTSCGLVVDTTKNTFKCG